MSIKEHIERLKKIYSQKLLIQINQS